MIFVDGSIMRGANNELTYQGGYGDLLLNETNNTITYKFCEHVETNDPQQAEQHGIYAAMQLTNTLNTQNQTIKKTMLCDCKNALRQMNRTISFSNLNRKTVLFVPFVPFQGENVRAVHVSLYRQKLASKLEKLNVEPKQRQQNIPMHPRRVDMKW